MSFIFSGATKKIQEGVNAAVKANKRKEQQEAAGGGADVNEKVEGLQSMPQGDYLIHVHVQKAKTLMLEQEDTCDPFIRVQVLGKNDSTQAKDDIARDATVTFDQHMFIECPGVTTEDLDEATVVISVENRGFFFGDMIGRFEIALSKIYNYDEHVMKHQWIGLNDPDSEDFANVTGYIGLSIQVQGPGDEAVELKLASKEQLDKKQPLMPTQIKKDYLQAYLRFYIAESLPKMDTNISELFSSDAEAGTIDAFCTVTYGGTTLETKWDTMKKDRVTWCQQMLIPIELPLREDTLKIQLWDKDYVSPDFVCTTVIQVKNILKYQREDANNENETSRWKWINFYGPPDNTSGAECDRMRRDNSCASKWCGRMLVQFFCVPQKYPIFKLKNLNDQLMKTVKPKLNSFTNPSHRYKIIFEAGSGICLPDSKVYWLGLHIGHIQLCTRAIESKANYCRWDKRLVKDFSAIYGDLKEFPTLYVYLLEGEDIKTASPICFYRESILKYSRYGDQGAQAKNGHYKWLQFEPDLAIGSVKSPMNAGMFSMRLYIHDIEKDGPFDETKIEAWKTQTRMGDEPSPLQKYRCRAAIYQCEQLPPADTEGSSDPYVEAWSTDGQKVVTTTCQDTNNPIFYEVLEFIIQFDKTKLDSAMPIVLNVWDSDEGYFDEDDIIGRAVIFLPDIINKWFSEKDIKQLTTVKSIKDAGFKHSQNDVIPEPSWYPVKRGLDDHYDKDTGASILASFQFKEINEQYEVNACDIELDNCKMMLPTPEGITYGTYYPMPDLEMTEYKVEVICLGLRNLVSSGILSVNKAFVKFNLKSLLPGSKAKAIQNIQTQPKEKGNNPNMRSTIQFEALMPSKTEFCPRMNCEAFDMVFAGLSQPLIGTFSLDLGSYAEQQNEKVRVQLQELDKSCERLNQILKAIEKSKPGDVQINIDKIIIEIIDKVSLKKSALALKQADQVDALAYFDENNLSLPDSKAKKAAKVKKSTSRVMDAPFEEGKSDPDGQINESQIPLNKEESETSIVTARSDLDKVKQALGQSMRKKIKLAYAGKQTQNKSKEEEKRNKDQLELSKKRPDGARNRIDPKYRLDQRLNVQVEFDPPPNNLFMQVGFDKVPGSGEKHYRRFYADELENVTDKDGHNLVESPFMLVNMYRAKEAKKQNMLDAMFGGGEEGPMTVFQTGAFKGKVLCYTEAEQKEQDEEIKQKMAKLIDLVKKIIGIATGNTDDLPKFDQLLGLLDQSRGGKIDHMETDSLLDFFSNKMLSTGLSPLNVKKLVCDMVFDHQLLSKMNEVIKAKVRVYMLSGFNMAKRDLFSKSDPYLVLKCGKKEFSERDNYQTDCDEPDFYKSYDFMIDLPGAPILEIECWDFDGLFGDEIIGKTVIDLDDRYFSLSWQSLRTKPIEYRDLFHYQTTVTQGVLKMWLEINNKDSERAQEEPIVIDPQPTIPLEMRVVVWKTEDIPNMDVEGCSDIQCKAYLSADDDRVTDTHWRCQNGKGSFNYRLKMKCDSKSPDLNLRVEAWDRDIIKSNDLIGGFDLDLREMRRDVLLTNKKVVLHQKYWEDYLKKELVKNNQEEMASAVVFEDKEQFWVPMRYNNPETNEVEKRGKLLISVHLMPQELADKYPQGDAREEPNNEPFCPEPEGRIKLSYNPIDMFFQLVPAEAIRKICCCLCCLACLALCAVMGPNIVSNLITEGISKGIGGN